MASTKEIEEHIESLSFFPRQVFMYQLFCALGASRLRSLFYVITLAVGIKKSVTVSVNA